MGPNVGRWWTTWQLAVYPANHVLGAHPGAAEVVVPAEGNAVVVAHHRRPLVLIDRETTSVAGYVAAEGSAEELTLA
jgi:hypothetical protein